MNPFAILLELQAADTAADQHRHRRAGLAARAELDAAEQALAELDAVIAEAGERRAEIARTQKRLEDEIAALESKADTEDRKLYSGSVTAIKELQALQAEIASLQRRQRAIEDDVLELMEQAEPLDAQLGDLDVRRAELAARVDGARARIAAAEAEIDAELARLHDRRDELARAVPAAILAEYDQLRARLGGVAAAKLEGGSCRGCHLQLSAVELDRIRKLPADAIVHCEECGRILVR